MSTSHTLSSTCQLRTISQCFSVSSVTVSDYPSRKVLESASCKANTLQYLIKKQYFLSWVWIKDSHWRKIPFWIANVKSTIFNYICTYFFITLSVFLELTMISHNLFLHQIFSDLILDIQWKFLWSIILVF